MAKVPSIIPALIPEIVLQTSFSVMEGLKVVISYKLTATGSTIYR
jgi:hypothetical protein